MDIITETAEGFFKTLEEACDKDTDISIRQRKVREAFFRSVEQTINATQLSFCGMFAKVDFIIKNTDMPYGIARLVNTTRRELFPDHNVAQNEEEQDMVALLPHHIKATALLVMYIFGLKEIPESLKKHFPKADRKNTWSAFDEKRLRVIVRRWDNEHIWATEEEQGTEIQICYGKENKYLSREGKGDWSYLANIMSEGCQLNLVRIRMDGDVCMPELIIYEPDYLINITTIASCFETYAESPYVNLVNKIKPQANSIPIHLGNLAGEFLDDTVHQRNTTFNEAFSRFIVRNSLGMISCKEMRDRTSFETFRKDAERQRYNIERLIGEDLPAEVKDYDAKRVMLEPSFFSELLGIQGRLDFLHEDTEGNAIIIEQKSGKGAFPGGADPDTPVPQEKHVVQLLLYRALLTYGFDKYSNQLQHIMLLYSKYKNGLVSLAMMPELLLRAFRMRNLLAWCEMTYATEGMKLLKSLTPEMLNKKHLSGRLWDGFIRLQLQELLTPIGLASNLELDYYLRFLHFLSTEQQLSKLGNKTKESSGFASIWNDTLTDKLAAGSIICSLECLPDIQEEETESVSILRMKVNGSDSEHSNFRNGDIVILYSYDKDKEPDACAQMVHRASIVSISAEVITLRLRNSQTDRRLFFGEGNDRKEDGESKGNERRWAIEHDLFESSSGGLYSAMHSFLSAPQERKDLILCQRKPRIDSNLMPKGEYGAFNTLITRAKQARDLFLIIGPPGTGKTSHGLVNLLNEELLEEGSNILLLSYTNRAVDEICSKLQEEGLDYIRIGAEFSCSREYREHLLSHKTAQCGSGNDVAQLIKSTRIFCGTTASINANIYLLGIKRFSLAIIDEASQILEPHLIGLLAARFGTETSIERFVLIGDHKQLPAVVQQTTEQSAVSEESLNAIGITDCRRSLFERLLTYAQNHFDEEKRKAIVYMLTKQGRMHPAISEFPNREFYGGKLDIVPLPHQEEECRNDDSRIVFYPSAKPEDTGTDKTNAIEAEMIAAKVVEIYKKVKESFDPLTSIGVIVPYRNQIATVRNAIERHGIPVLQSITIDTVERYQGSQRDYILYGFTIQKRYQLNFLASETFEEDGMLIDRKLNVAMTRARKYLYLFGNPEILAENVTFRRLMEFCNNQQQ